MLRNQEAGFEGSGARPNSLVEVSGTRPNTLIRRGSLRLSYRCVCVCVHARTWAMALYGGPRPVLTICDGQHRRLRVKSGEGEEEPRNPPKNTSRPRPSDLCARMCACQRFNRLDPPRDGTDGCAPRMHTGGPIRCSGRRRCGPSCESLWAHGSSISRKPGQIRETARLSTSRPVSTMCPGSGGRQSDCESHLMPTKRERGNIPSPHLDRRKQCLATCRCALAALAEFSGVARRRFRAGLRPAHISDGNIGFVHKLFVPTPHPSPVS